VSLLFKAHLKSMQKLLPFGIVACVPPFEQLAMKCGDCLHENILKRLPRPVVY
jgi:hypothetical protein